jgi:hypothetical protein
MVFPLTQVTICRFYNGGRLPEKSRLLFLRCLQSSTNWGQLYRQRLAALQSGYIYTQFPPNSFESAWLNTSGQPNYDEWISLLKQEAEFIATGDGNRRLGIVLGDSLSLWLPTNGLPEGTLWLNQGISGDTTSGLLRRISLFANTRPEVIYVMAGINDLRRGSTDLSVQMNLNEVIRQLRSQHPDAQIVIQSILPTRFATLPTDSNWSFKSRISCYCPFRGGSIFGFNHRFFRRRRAVATGTYHRWATPKPSRLSSMATNLTAS